jgi:hypothetical protein
MKPINPLCGKNTVLLNVKAGGTYSYHRFLKSWKSENKLGRIHFCIIKLSFMLRKGFLQSWELKSKGKRIARENLMIKQMVDGQWEEVQRDADVVYAVYCNYRRINGRRTQTDEQSERIGINEEYETMEARFVTNAAKRTEEAITCCFIIILPRIIILIPMHAIP